MLAGIGKYPSRTAWSDTYLPSFRQRDVQLPFPSQSCLSADVLTEGSLYRKAFQTAGSHWTEQQGQGDGTNTPLPLLALGKENSAWPAAPLEQWGCACHGHAELPLRLL